MLLEGLFLPLNTPYLPDGRLNLPKLRENVVRYAKTPAAGIVALARTGQPSLLSDTESREVLQSVAVAATAEKVLIAGIARDSVMHALDLVVFAAKEGYDAALVPLPSFLHRRPSHKEAVSYFETLADAATLPLILDSGPGEESLAPEIILEVAKHKNVLGVLNADADLARIAMLRRETAGIRREVMVTQVFAAVTGRMLAKYRPHFETLLSPSSLSGGGVVVAATQPSVTGLKTRSKTVGLQILCGCTSGILESLSAGSVGAVPPLAASAPQACYEVLAAWKDGDPALAAEKQHRLQLAAAIVEEELDVSGLKYAGDLNGYFGGRPRLPSLPLSSAERARVETAMAGLRN